MQKRNLLPVKGQCNEASRSYGHDYLNCNNCTVNRDLKCFITDCPCSGKGFLFILDENKKLYVHQIPGIPKSLKIYANRPKRAFERMRKAINRYNSMTATRNSIRNSTRNPAKLVVAEMIMDENVSMPDTDAFNSNAEFDQEIVLLTPSPHHEPESDEIKDLQVSYSVVRKHNVEAYHANSAEMIAKSKEEYNESNYLLIKPMSHYKESKKRSREKFEYNEDFELREAISDGLLDALFDES